MDATLAKLVNIHFVQYESIRENAVPWEIILPRVIKNYLWKI